MLYLFSKIAKTGLTRAVNSQYHLFHRSKEFNFIHTMLRIICCITGGTGIPDACDDNGCADDGDDDYIFGDGDNDLEGTASVIEVTETCEGRGSNCARAFTISPSANFSIAALCCILLIAVVIINSHT